MTKSRHLISTKEIAADEEDAICKYLPRRRGMTKMRSTRQ